MNTVASMEAWLAELRRRIIEIAPCEAVQRQVQGAVLLDVREESERAAGTPLGAQGLSRSFLELRIAQLVPDRDQVIMTLCGSGVRSLFAADTLLQMGYRTVISVAGGYERWKMEGLPIVQAMLDADAAERYARQLRLPQIGIEGQAKLGRARVALLGAGGLGSPAALYLAAAGVGQLTLIDHDVVERSNLHRQVIHADARVGMAKTTSARMSLAALNPRIRIDAIQERLGADNAERLLVGHDLIIDGADNFPARYLLAVVSRRLQLPVIYGAVERFTGQLSVFDPHRDDSPCYRCLFPLPPAAEDAPNCAEAGVLGVLPGIIGLLQTTEALKLLLGLGEALVGRLLMFDALAMRFRELALFRDPACPGCGRQAGIPRYEDIAGICASV